MTEARHIFAGRCSNETEDGSHPFHPDLICNLLEESGSKDQDYIHNLRAPVPVGVEETLLKSPGIWPTKEEMRGENCHGQLRIEGKVEGDFEAFRKYPSTKASEERVGGTY